ncbi:MAG TPA: ATP-binding protein [Candidatus Omnitrophota bacterium]|nr:ATP-binding protein [Candidatus Omnitrophota bacterium]HPT39334.1 ATP-binding protein [Candidatus Omnitrophota bacterium]
MIKDKFFDRRNYIQILEKRVSSLKEGYRQNIAIIGDENVGKTSIISKFLANYYDPRMITVYLEIRPESLEGFAKRFIGALLYNFLLNSGLPLKEDLDYLVVKSSRYIPKTTERINFILGELARRKKLNIITELFNLPELINQETGKFTVLFFDEFHNLEDIGVKNLYREWSKLLMVAKNTLYCLASSKMFKTRVILSKQLSLLFGNFEIITVEPFDIHASSRYLDQHLPGLNAKPELKDFIINFTGGYPLYLELIADALAKADATVNLADILEDLLFNTSGILNQRFSNYIKRFLDADASNDYVSIFYLIASGRNRIKDIAHILHKQKKELDIRINYLLELDAITRSGDFLKVSDRLFAYWMRFVYQEKIRSLSFDAKNQKEKFRENIQELIQEFAKQSIKPLANRVGELLQLFEDDLVQIERKKIRLHHFREVKPLTFDQRFLKDGLLGRSSEALWIMAIKSDALTEQDIAEFSKECKRYHHKSQRKIMVTLKEVDPNARLRALEEKIWTWDLNSLNQILDLFSKPRIIA